MQTMAHGVGARGMVGKRRGGALGWGRGPVVRPATSARNCYKSLLAGRAAALPCRATWTLQPVAKLPRGIAGTKLACASCRRQTRCMLRSVPPPLPLRCRRKAWPHPNTKCVLARLVEKRSSRWVLRVSLSGEMTQRRFMSV